MTRATLIRVLLAAAVAAASVVHEAHGQINRPPTPTVPTTPPTPTTPPPAETPPPPAPLHLPDSGRSDATWIVSAVVIGVIGWLIARYAIPEQTPGLPSARRFPAGDPTLVQQPGSAVPTQLPGPGGTAQPRGTSPKPPRPGSEAPPGDATTTRLRAGFNLPPAGETRFGNEVLLDIPARVPTATLDAIAARHAMTRLETNSFRLTGRTLHRWRIDGGGSVADTIRSLAMTEPPGVVAGAQPNYLYALAEAAAPVNAEQYAPRKLGLPEAHRLATGNRVVVAVIDSEVDASHPDLAGAVTGSFNASPDREKPHAHGTAMAGAIGARRTVVGAAPRVGLLTVNAFSTSAAQPEGTTFTILKGLDWAATQGARIINMSFAGPSDPRLRDALLKANRKGIVLIAAVGNAGPTSPPLFPAADPNVIAVTATDIDDALFTGANRGTHIAVAAPGVDVLAPAPDGAYQFTTGTSVAAAEVSGVVALLLERNPALTPAEVRRILVNTAKDLGPKGRDPGFGAGLVDALRAVITAPGGRPQTGY